MATLAQEQSLSISGNGSVRRESPLRGPVAYARRNPELVVGLGLVLSLLVFVGVGHLFVDFDKVKPLSNRPLLPPSPETPFGTDRQGRDLLAVMVLGIPQTLQVALLAGTLGVSIGTLLALVSAFYGGRLDTIIRLIVDVGLTVPGLMVLVTLATIIRGRLSMPQMALVVAALAWLHPARVVRAQVLSLREQAFVDVARLSGMPRWVIMLKEILPNLMPYVLASLVGAISAAVVATVGLEVIGLGSFDSVTIGMTLYWVIYYAAIINSWWWWWLPPIVTIIILFLGLFLIAVGLDEFANPRARRRA